MIDWIEKIACKVYDVNINDYERFIDCHYSKRLDNEEEFGIELSDKLYSVLSFIDGYTYFTVTAFRTKIERIKRDLSMLK